MEGSCALSLSPHGVSLHWWSLPKSVARVVVAEWWHFYHWVSKWCHILIELAVFVMKCLAYRYFFKCFVGDTVTPEWCLLCAFFFFKCCALYPLFSKICAASLQSRIHSGFTTAGISALETCPRVRVQTHSINHFVILSPSNNDTLFYYSSLTLDVTFTADQWGSKWAMLIIPAGQWQHSDVWLNKQPWVWPTWDQGFLEFRLVEFILMVHVLCILQTIQCFGFNNW